MSRFAAKFALGLCLAAVFALMSLSPAMAGQQENVDYIIGRIRTTLNESLNSPGWRAKYSLASKNIEDLRKTLALGGKISSNPVKEYNGVLTEMLEERKAEFKAYCDAQEKLDKSRKKAAKQAINDVGMEMINRITPKPGIFTPFSQARTKNAQVIKDDFARLRTIDEAIATLEQYKKNILPSIREIRDRRQALGPLLTQFASLTAGFDGTYKGRFQGEASGTITFTVKGKSVSGSLSGSYRGDSIQGRFSGIVDTHGNVSTSLSGSLTDMSKNRMGSFPFKGNVNGRINGVSGSGRWTAKNKWGAPAGGWSVSKN